MVEQIITKRDEVKGLLRKLFRSDQADLDFGIYRIMNFKRKEIEKFIDHDLIEYAEAEFKEYSRASTADLERELEEDRRRIEGLLGSGVFSAAGDPVKYLDVKAVQEYEEKRKALRVAALTEEQVNDVFSHVYEFFSRYYEDGDFIPKTRYGGRDKYYIPYNGEEVVLHWATKDMYYVKTGEYFKKYSFKAGRFTLTFRLVDAKVETGNVKGEKKFFILADEDPVLLDEVNSSVEIRFNYRELSEEEKKKHGTRNEQPSLVSEAIEKIQSHLESSSILGILRSRIGKDRSLIEKHLNIYVERNTKDFFIHKELKAFLEREIDFYLKNEVWSLDDLEAINQSGTRITAAKLKAIRNISLKIIEFLNQIESFQMYLFEKKKFIFKLNYIFSLRSLKKLLDEKDYIYIKNIVIRELNDNINYREDIIETIKEIYKKPLQNIYVKDVILNDNNIKMTYNKINKDDDNSSNSKLSDFKEFEINDDFKKDNIYESDKLIDEIDIDKIYIDTKFLNEEFKYKLLELVSNKVSLDDFINGYLIKSDNIHALNLLYNKYHDKIDMIYIDPPFNTKDSGFLYLDEYLDSSWLSMMYDRIFLSNYFLKNEGSMYLHLDHSAYFYGRILMNLIYSKDNFQREITWNTSRVISGFKTRANNWIRQHDTILYYSKSSKPKFRKLWNLYKEDDENIKSILGWLDFIGDEKNELYLEKYENDNKYISNIKCDNYKVMRIGDVWNDVLSLIYTQLMTRENWSFFTQKPENLLRRIIQSSTYPNDIVMDFFGGAGTTLASAHKLSRKWIGIEMGEQFENQMLRRMKTVIFGDVRPFLSRDLNWNGGGSLQYFNLEQYEDSLNNLEFINPDGTIQKTLHSYPDYFISYMIKDITKESHGIISIDNFQTPFNYKIKILNGEKESEEIIDLVETFNYLLGLKVNKIKLKNDNSRVYKTIIGERDHEQVTIIWRDTSGLDLDRDKRFIEDTILADLTPETIFVNGDSFVKNAKPIEPEFRRLMGA